MGAEREFHRRAGFAEAKRQTIGIEVDGNAIRNGLTTAAKLRASVRRHVMRKLCKAAPWRAGR